MVCILELALATISLSTKYEVFISTYYVDMMYKMSKMEWFG